MSKKISVTLPDDAYAAALLYANRDHRTVPNLCAFATRLYLSKYAPYHASKPPIPPARNGPPAGPKAETGPEGADG